MKATNQSSKLLKNLVLILMFLTNIILTSSCKKEIKTEYSTNLNLQSSDVSLSQFEIQEFIDSVNSVYLRQNSSSQIDLNKAINLMESSLNYSFSDIDTALINEDTSTFHYDFTLSSNSTGKCDFLNVSNVTKNIAKYIKSNCTGGEIYRYSIGNIEKLNQEGSYRLKITIGEMDADFDYSTPPTAPEANGNYLWRVDPYNFYNYTNCQLNQPYAPIVLQEKINSYLLNIANYRTREIALAALPGFVLYYDDRQTVYNSSHGFAYFDYTDFVNLSKMDWPSDMLAYNDYVSCGPKSGKPFQSPIFAADPEKVACLILFNPAVYGYKSCLTQATMNYYIKKSAEIYDVIKPTRLNDLFSSLNIVWVEPKYQGEPIEHRYEFFTKKAKTRPKNTILL
ncbi:MAG: hypothetical protein CFE21_03875 [Bacteroidetes bacterium B1(2017)]|nr:MAG: hypothetical protein CFE21_03875 [Bacteroidetes bacterium B1(2017)]